MLITHMLVKNTSESSICVWDSAMKMVLEPEFQTNGFYLGRLHLSTDIYVGF